MTNTLPYINLESIPDLSVRSAVVTVLNLLETALKEIQDLKIEIQELKNEIANLKGEQGKPNIKAKNNNQDISSESYKPVTKEKRKISSRKDKIKNKQIKIDRVVICQLNKDNLPSDIINKGYETTISQNIIFKSDNVEYKREKFYSPSLKQTFIASLPDEYNGYIDKNLKTFCQIFHHGWDISRNKLMQGLSSIGVYLSAGTLNNILTESGQIIIQEKENILKAGLGGSYVQIDGTSSRFFGMNYTTQIICSPHFTVFSTLPRKSRLCVLFALQGEPVDGLQYSYNQETIKYLEHFKVSKTNKLLLENKFTSGQSLTEAEFLTTISEECPVLYSKPNMFKRIKESFAFGYYFTQTDFPSIEYLVADDAPEYKMLATYLMLCWIHDARYYNKLTPRIENHKIIIDNFKQKYWDFYRQLQEYRKAPTTEKIAILESSFDKLFIDNTNYFSLDKEIRRTKKNKKELLTVLYEPVLPLHNNLAELKARVKVRKRDISLHTMSKIGTQIQDAMMSILQTTQQQGVDSWKYIAELLYGENKSSLADLILEKQNNTS
jgi:hypothetical protein